jgi:hypothetical protein
VMAITAVARRLPCRINIKRKETTTTTTASIMYRRTYVDPVHLYKPRDSIFPIFSYTTGTFISKGERKNKLGDIFLFVDFGIVIQQKKIQRASPIWDLLARSCRMKHKN